MFNRMFFVFPLELKVLKEGTNSMQQNHNQSQEDAVSHLRERGIFLFLPRHDSYENTPLQVEQTLQLIREAHHSSARIWLLHFSLVLPPTKKMWIFFLELRIYLFCIDLAFTENMTKGHNTADF